VCPEFRGVRARQHGGGERGGHAHRVALRGRPRVPARRPRRHRALLRDAVQRRRDDVRLGQGAACLHGRVGSRPRVSSPRAWWPRRIATPTSCPSTWAAPRPRSVSSRTGSSSYPPRWKVGAQAVTPLGEGRGRRPIRCAHPSSTWWRLARARQRGVDRRGRRASRRTRSAGARPGPACYGLGGVTPTITDANLALGRLDPAFFLGGEMTLDADAARRAVAERVAGASPSRSPRRGQRHRGDRQCPHDRRHAPRLRPARL